MGRVAGKVVLVTGAARGQGRSHAIRLAEEGADVIAFDVCADIGTNEYPLATEADLDETARLVEKAGGRIVAAEVDVRDRAALEVCLADAVAQLGRLDVVVANAGICPLGKHLPAQAFVDAFDVDFVGVVNTVHAALPYLPEAMEETINRRPAVARAAQEGVKAWVDPEGYRRYVAGQRERFEAAVNTEMGVPPAAK